MNKRVTEMHRHPSLSGLIGLTVLLGTLLAWAPVSTAVENWFEQGLEALQERRYQAAADKFTLAIEAVPDDFEAFNNRGFARIYTGDYDGAIQDCSHSLVINPASAKAYNNRGFARLFTGDFEAAIGDFDQALAINPRYGDAYSNRGLAWTRMGDYAKAITDCSEALRLNPRSAKGLYNRGFARDRQGDPGGAMRDYIRALKVNPAFTEVFNNMAWILATSPEARLRDGRRAVAYAEMAVSSTPGINFLDTLAAAYAEAGRFDEAVAIENRILSRLASTRQTDALAIHAARLNLYEDGQPYREPIAIEPFSAVTDLQGELAALDRLIFAPEVTAVAYEPAESALILTAEATGNKDAAGRVEAPREEPGAALTVPDAFSQSVQTFPGLPVEISLAAEPEGIPLTFEIETVPYQGALQGTLPNLLYTPRPGFEGVDRFTFRARNAAGISNLATVTITVAEAPAAPASDEETALPDTPDPATHKSPPATGEEPVPPAAAATDGASRQAAPAPEIGELERPGKSEPESSESRKAPAAAAPVAREPEDELSSPALYTIQVGSVKESAGAAGMVARLRAEGHAAFSLAVEVPEKGPWHRVFLNGYPSLAAARTALQQLDPERFRGAFIRRMPDGIRLPAAGPAPGTAIPAARPLPESVVPVDAPVPEPAIPAETPAPVPEVPARGAAPEPAVPASPTEPHAKPPLAPDAAPSDDVSG